ncbi:MAG: serine hydrolase [Pseudomonadota bacterium]|nr:serine hydrolase [Xanthomonadaceae bacterium]MDE2249394.1 serine hydrolase [Xanthomonadaceae bacterium]MDE3210006.1 serine hydrolase [Pseudomonadota bacterium]
MSHTSDPAGGTSGLPEANLDVPSEVGVMVGFPPLPENQVRAANAASPRFLRWSLLNASQIHNTVRVSRGLDPAAPLSHGNALDFDALAIPYQGESIPAGEFFRRTGTDALLVMHRGGIVFERYLGDMGRRTLHALNSATKSLVGTLVAMLATEGELDVQARASHYVPELASSALGSATLDQLLDMRANFRFGDAPHQAGKLQLEVHHALGTLPRPPGYAGPDGIHELMLSARPTTPHGSGPMRYDNGSTEALGWVLTRVTGRRIARLLGERFWEPIGAEMDGDFLLDTKKFEIAAFGLQACARDVARFGEMMRCDGSAAGRQVVPAAVVDDIRRGGDRAAFAASPSAVHRPGGSYRRQWWVNHDVWDSYQVSGQYGQRLWISPRAETVIVQLSTDPDASGSREPLRGAAYAAIAGALS